MEISARLYHCARCHCQVIICRYCDRGNIYCGSKCSSAARTESLRSANQRYQKTSQGKRMNAERQRRHREKKKEKTKIVTDQGSNENAEESSSVPQDVECELRCCFCKKRVSALLRSGFLRYGAWDKRISTGALAQGP